MPYPSFHQRVNWGFDFFCFVFSFCFFFFRVTLDTPLRDHVNIDIYAYADTAWPQF